MLVRHKPRMGTRRFGTGHVFILRDSIRLLGGTRPKSLPCLMYHCSGLNDTPPPVFPWNKAGHRPTRACNEHGDDEETEVRQSLVPSKGTNPDKDPVPTAGLLDFFHGQGVTCPELCYITSMAVGHSVSIYWIGLGGPGAR